MILRFEQLEKLCRGKRVWCCFGENIRMMFPDILEVLQTRYSRWNSVVESVKAGKKYNTGKQCQLEGKDWKDFRAPSLLEEVNWREASPEDAPVLCLATMVVEMASEQGVCKESGWLAMKAIGEHTFAEEDLNLLLRMLELYWSDCPDEMIKDLDSYPNCAVKMYGMLNNGSPDNRRIVQLFISGIPDYFPIRGNMKDLKYYQGMVME